MREAGAGRTLGRVLGVAAAAGAGALAWSLAEAQWFALRRVRVPVLPPGASDVRVLHISDLHLVPSQRRKIAWVRSLAEHAPDLVVNTGDNMAHRHALPAVLEAFEPLLDVPGAFVMGSNDYFQPVFKNPARYLRPRDPSPPTSPPPGLPGMELGRAFTAAGWKDLTNTRDQLQTRGVRFTLVGVDDPHLGRDVFPERPDLPRAGHEPIPPDGAASSAPTVHLGLTHAPYRRVLDLMCADGAALTLAGHTHGGQLCVPGYGALVTNCDLDTNRASGLHGWPANRPDSADGRFTGAPSMWLHVSAGLGTSPFTPVRFACRPEATMLTLTAR